MIILLKIFLQKYKKAFAKPHRILPFLKKFLFSKKKRIREHIYHKKLIWHFCTPKSASSYLVYLMKNSKINTVLSLPYYGKRVQINDFFFLDQKIKKYSYSDYIYLTHTHTPFDDYLNQFISEKHIVLIQTRNIYKSVLSLRDFIIRHNISKPNPWVQWDYDQYSEKELLKLLIYYYVPFHVNFVKSWFECKIKGRKIFIDYESFVKDPKQLFNEIFLDEKKDSIIIPDLKKIDKQKINYNIGLTRKNNLTDEEKKLIDDIVDVNLKYSNPLIKDIIYK